MWMSAHQHTHTHKTMCWCWCPFVSNFHRFSDEYTNLHLEMKYFYGKSFLFITTFSRLSFPLSAFYSTSHGLAQHSSTRRGSDRSPLAPICIEWTGRWNVVYSMQRATNRNTETIDNNPPENNTYKYIHTGTHNNSRKVGESNSNYFAILLFQNQHTLYTDYNDFVKDHINPIQSVCIALTLDLYVMWCDIWYTTL